VASNRFKHATLSSDLTRSPGLVLFYLNVKVSHYKLKTSSWLLGYKFIVGSQPAFDLAIVSYCLFCLLLIQFLNNDAVKLVSRWSNVTNMNATQKPLNWVVESPPPFLSSPPLIYIWKQYRSCVFVTDISPSRPPHVWNVLATGFVIAWGVWSADHRVLLPRKVITGVIKWEFHTKDGLILPYDRLLCRNYF